MSKTFRAWEVDQIWLLPPSVHELVPEGHLAHFVRETVRESLDLSEILAAYSEERGFPPYHPTMMTALLLYAYTQGVYSSRRIARGCEERVDFMAVTALQRPDFRTISEFRKRHLEALAGLFRQVLQLCQKAGLVKLGHVALDGTKIRANASKHKAMSYGRMLKAEPQLDAEVRRWLEQAAKTDRQEDRQYGEERRGDELPDWVSNKQRRLEKLREAKAALEAEAAAKDSDPPEPRGPGGRKRKRPPGVPHEKAQRNFTDPESRIMKTSEGFQQCYNAQAAVDGAGQIIVACGLTRSAADCGQLLPMVDRIQEQTGAYPGEVSADCGYCTEEGLEGLDQRGIRGYIATGKQKHSEPTATTRRNEPRGKRTLAMQRRLRRAGRRSRYRLRKQIVEPVFGQTKFARGFRQFLLRGESKVTSEWSLVCTASNLRKLAASRRS